MFVIVRSTQTWY